MSRFTIKLVLAATALTLTLHAFIVPAYAQSPISEDPYTDPRDLSYDDSYCDDFGYAAYEIPIERYRKSFCQGAEILGGYLFDMGDQNGGLDQTWAQVVAAAQVRGALRYQRTQGCHKMCRLSASCRNFAFHSHSC